MSIRRLLAAVVVCTGMIVLSHSAALAQGSPLFAVLLGGNEVSVAGDANAGDLTAFGSATVNFHGLDTICWAILVSGFDTPTAAHIHTGRAGVNGGIRVTLVAPNGGNPGTASGCITNASTTFAATIRAIKANPTSFYINVHSDAFPGGGLRGQLF
jgi:hypothetical protein